MVERTSRVDAQRNSPEGRILPFTAKKAVFNRYDRFPRDVAIAVDELLEHLKARKAIPTGYYVSDDGARGSALYLVEGDCIVYRHSPTELTVLSDKTWLHQLLLHAPLHGYNPNSVIANYLEKRVFKARP